MELVPLGPGFGAEVRGVSLLDVASDADAYKAVRTAFEDHSLLAFREQDIADDVQVASSRDGQRRSRALDTYLDLGTNEVEGRVFGMHSAGNRQRHQEDVEDCGLAAEHVNHETREAHYSPTTAGI